MAPTCILFRQARHSSSIHSCASMRQWLSPLLRAGNPSVIKQPLQVHASGLTTALEYPLNYRVTSPLRRCSHDLPQLAWNVSAAWLKAEESRFASRESRQQQIGDQA